MGERSRLDWFLTEDCCESKLQRNVSSPGFVIDMTPVRNTSLVWNSTSMEFVGIADGNDSFAWDANLSGVALGQRECTMVDIDAGLASRPEDVEHGSSVDPSL